jgi:hypothetical protein
MDQFTRVSGSKEYNMDEVKCHFQMDQLRMAILKITFSKVRQLHLNWLMSLKTFKNEIINEFF